MTTPTTRAELAICPFCGAEVTQEDVGAHVIQCPSCGCHGPAYPEAVSAWNRRAAAPVASAGGESERERLRAAQAMAVMPLIGPLLDAFECNRSLLRDEANDLFKSLRAIDDAMEGAEPAPSPAHGLKDEQVEK